MPRKAASEYRNSLYIQITENNEQLLNQIQNWHTIKYLGKFSTATLAPTI